MKEKGFAIEKFHRPLLPTTRDLVGIGFRQRWLIATIFVLVFSAIGLSGFWVPKYDAQIKIMVRTNRPEALIGSSANQSQLINDQVSQEEINSEVELLNSEDLLRKVALSTGLAGPQSAGDDRGNEVRIARAVRMLSSSLTIEPLRRSNVISVRYSSQSPELAKSVLESLASAYVEKHLEVHQSNDEFKFFDQQMDQYQHGVTQADKDLNDFTKSTGVVSAQIERDGDLTQANEFASKAAEAQTALQETEQRISVLTKQLQSMQPRVRTVVRTADNSQLLEQLKGTLLNLQLKRTELLTKFDPSYRLVQEVDQQIGDTKSAIEAAENRPIREESSDQNPDYLFVQSELTKAQADLVGLKERAQAAASVAAQYHSSAERLGQQEIQEQNLERAAKTQTDNYLLYQQKREEARINDALDQRGILNVALAEHPIVPALPEKSPFRLAFLTIFIAGALSLTTGVVVDFVDPTFRTPDELANYLDMPVLAALPKPATLSKMSGE
jgi:succinoglycan biosynthesis transport protein ExoP